MTDDTPTAAHDQHGLIMAANAEPYKHIRDDSGDVTVEQVSGGVSTGLNTLMQQTGGAWIGWGRGDADFEPDALDEYVPDDDQYTVQVPPDAPENDQYTLHRIRLDATEEDEFYYGFSNQVLWPGAHGFNGRDLPDNITYENRFWDTYQEVNKKYADTVIDAADDASQPVILHDYQLAMTPEYIADEADNPLGMFWHINFPDAADWQEIPHDQEVFDSLMQNDLFQLHTEGYVENVLDVAEQYYGADAVDRADRTVTVDGHTTTVAANPLGIQPGSFQDPDAELQTVDTGKEVTMMGLARSDPIKGIPEGLDGLQRYLAQHPAMADSLSMTYKLTPSRTRIDVHQDVIDEAEHRTAIINTVNSYLSRTVGEQEHEPADLYMDHMPQEDLKALLRDADVALINSIVDGLNLVAKEYVDAKQAGDEAHPGSIVLGQDAGVAETYRDHMPDELIIEGGDPEQAADAIDYAVAMTDDDGRTMMDDLYRNEVAQQTIDTWLQELQDNLAPAAARNGKSHR